MKQVLRWYLSGFYKKPKVRDAPPHILPISPPSHCNPTEYQHQGRSDIILYTMLSFWGIAIRFFVYRWPSMMLSALGFFQVIRASEQARKSSWPVAYKADLFPRPPVPLSHMTVQDTHKWAGSAVRCQVTGTVCKGYVTSWLGMNELKCHSLLSVHHAACEFVPPPTLSVMYPVWLQGLKKPYNPILGETFRCCWLHPQTDSCTFYIAEQVSHIPPVSPL